MPPSVKPPSARQFFSPHGPLAEWHPNYEFRPGQLEEMAAGRMGPFPVTQGSLLTAALLMLVPALMVFLSLALPTRAVSRRGRLIKQRPL